VSNAANFYDREGDSYVPTGLGVSPWNGTTQGGMALAGLTAHLFGSVQSLSPMQTTRLTIDILGAVPMEPLVPEIRLLREGKRIQLLELELKAKGRSWLRASALRARTEDTPARPEPLDRALPDTLDLPRSTIDLAEVIAIEGHFMEPGPAARWVRFTKPIVAGTMLAPLERIAMLADWGSGIGSWLSPKEWTLANLDISLYLSRMPRGEWLLLDTSSETAGNGLAIANNRLGDCEGMIGTSHQTVFLNHRQIHSSRP